MRFGISVGWTKSKERARPFFTMLQGLAITLPLGGCLLQGEPPDPALDIPKSYDAGPRAAHTALPAADWWRSFRSSELTGIVENARANNLDIAAAVARIAQADAQARIAGAPLLPAIGLDASALRARSSQTTSSGGGFSGSSERDLLSNSLTASYEIDFWGKNRSALLAAEETAVASRFNRDVVELATEVAAANAYFQVLAAQDRLRVARENQKSANDVLELIKQRQAAGTASQLDVAQQQSVVDTQRAAIPPLEQTLRQNKVALATLMARPIDSANIRGGSLNNITVPRVTPGLPSELLTQRPDIRQAEANLAAANANVDNARAQLLPSVVLTGEGGYQSAVLKTLLRPESALYNVAAGLTQPIFEGGRLLGNLDLQKGRQDELLQNYRKAVISGFADVENALDAIRQTALREQLQRSVLASARQAYDISQQRLREGTIDLIILLQTQQTLFQAEDQLVTARLAHMQAIVGLYQALGGGWRPNPKMASNAR